MTRAEAVHTLQPTACATAALVEFVSALRFESLDAEVRHYACRHLLDTLGVMISGAAGDVATRAEAMLVAVRGAGRIPVPGRARRADLLDAAFLGGTAAHGIELDDGYRQGSVHPGCAVVPAVLSAGYETGASGKAVIEAIVAGYDTTVAIARAPPIMLPPAAAFGIPDCYIKPYACCRHIQPAIEALMGLCRDENIVPEEVTGIDVDTYRIAAEHAHTGWDDYASAQLSFPYLIGLALRLRGVKMKYFEDATRQDPAFGGVARMLHGTAPPEIDRLYPQLRPARVPVTTAG